MTPETNVFRDRVSFVIILAFCILISVAIYFGLTNWIFLTGILLVVAFVIIALGFYKDLLIKSLFLFVPLSFPLGVLGSSNVSLPSEGLLILLSISILFVAIKHNLWEKKILFHPLTIILLLDSFWMMVSTAFSTMPEVSVKRLALRLLFVLFYYIFIAHWLRKSENLKYPILMYALGCVPIVLIALKKHAIWNFSPAVAVKLSQPFFADHTIYGACLAFCIPFLMILIFRFKKFELNGYWISGLAVLLLIILTGEIFSFSRASWISLVGAFLLFVLIKLKLGLKSILLIVGVGIIIITTQFDNINSYLGTTTEISNQGNATKHLQSITNLSTDPSNLERLNRWSCAFRMFIERPLVGFGPGTYQFQYGKFQRSDELTSISTFSGDGGNAHSEYLSYLSETGLPGFLLFLALVLYTLHLGISIIFRQQNTTGSILALAFVLGLSTFIIHALFNSFLDQDKMASLVYSSMAALVVLDLYQREGIPSDL